MSANKPQHYHCPNDCDKPQPFEFEGKWYCGRCWVHGGRLVEAIECTPDICDD